MSCRSSVVSYRLSALCNYMSLTAHRVIQYIVIITLCTLAGGGYWYWKDQQAKASVVLKTATDTGLVGYWSFDEGSGTKAEDFSPANANTGTLTNSPTWVDGKVGKALSFDGTDDWVDIGSSSSLNVSTDYTISMWVYNAAGSDTYPTLLNRATQATNNGFFWIYTTGTNEADLNFQYSDGSNFITTTFSAALTTNTWQHVVFTFDNASKALKLYINGSQFSTTRTLTGSLPIDDGTLYLGTYNGSATSYSFLGYLDEVRIYTSALSAGGVTDLYQSSAKASMNTSENSDFTNGLVGLWSFNGADVSGTTAYDRSGNGNNATMSGGPTVALGKIGQALDFDGSNDYTSMGDPASAVLDPTGSFSLSAWVKTTQTKGAADYAAIVGKGFLISANGYGLFLDGDNSSKPAFQARTGATIVSAQSSVSINDGAWHHLVGVRDHAGNITQLYVDGVLAGSGSGALTSYASTYYFGVGSRYSGSLWETFFFDGSVDEVRMYNRTLSATEIWNLYQAGGGAILNSPDLQIDALEQGLAGYWKLDDGSGTSATDASTNGNTGTLTNGPTWTTGQIGGAVDFDGTNDVITTSTVVPNMGTVSAWVNTTAVLNSSDYYYFVGGAVAGNSMSLRFDSYSGYNRWEFNMRGNFGTDVYVNGPTLTTNTQQGWHHLTAVWDTSKGASLYLDGALLNSTTTTTSAFASMALSIGNPSSATWLGKIDEVRVYTRALSAEEIAKLYKSTAPDNPDSGLKGYWSFNGRDVSGTTAFDRSGAGNNGTLTNGPTVALGKIGQALSFDGSNDYVSAGDVNAVDGASTVTLSGWFKRGASNAYLTVGKATGNVRGFNINFYNDGRVYVNVGDGSGINTYGFFNSNDTDWHHVVFVFDGSLSGNANRAKAYLDGVQQSLTFFSTIPATTPSSSDSFEIGRDVNLGTYSSGSIDEVRLYSRAFTQTEVTNLYNLGR
jgi:hypothetical protein